MNGDPRHIFKGLLEIREGMGLESPVNSWGYSQHIQQILEPWTQITGVGETFSRTPRSTK